MARCSFTSMSNFSASTLLLLLLGPLPIIGHPTLFFSITDCWAILQIFLGETSFVNGSRATEAFFQVSRKSSLSLSLEFPQNIIKVSIGLINVLTCTCLCSNIYWLYEKEANSNISLTILQILQNQKFVLVFRDIASTSSPSCFHLTNCCSLCCSFPPPCPPPVPTPPP